MFDQIHIGTLKKNASEEVRVLLYEYSGFPVFDVRVFGDFTGTEAEKRATKKGVSMRIEKLDDLIQLLIEARAEAERLEWLEPTRGTPAGDVSNGQRCSIPARP